ncbi:MAG TPA: inositol monophosphatase family protein [Stellaceae bacterium]|nr:inositol monophosphatase family protein [Stellaceae bacterium]
MTPSCPADLVSFANRLADVAGDILRLHTHRAIDIEIKPDGTQVTNVDKAVERAVRQEIESHYPEHGIRGEEFPAVRADAEYVWIIDPLDGTREFIYGLPLFGFLLALTHRGTIVLGLADQPSTRDRWLGADGHGTVFNGTPVTVRSCPTLAEATISTMGYDTFCAQHHDRLLALRNLARARVTADSFYVFGLVALGRVDLIASSGFALHDYASLDAIIRNAGGTVTDWQGRRLTLTSDGTILVAGDAALIPEALRLLGTN